MAGIIAPRTYHPGDLIHEEKVFARVLPRSLKDEVCEACYKRSTNLKSCTRCLGVKYCNKECQSADWKDHKLECKHLINLTEENQSDLVHLLGRVIMKIKGKNWKNIQQQVLNTTVSFDDIPRYDKGREESTSIIIFHKEMKELTRKYIGEQNMPPEEDFYTILEKILYLRGGRKENDRTKSFLFLGSSKFEFECIPNANMDISSDGVLKIWACKEIKQGTEKISIKSPLNRGLFITNIGTENNNCNCSDCSLPYGESILSKIVDEDRAYSVISETERFLYSLRFLPEPFMPKVEYVNELLKRQEAVLGSTHILHLKLLQFKCFELADHPKKVMESLKKLEACTRMVYGEYSGELSIVYGKSVVILLRLHDFPETVRCLEKSLKVTIDGVLKETTNNLLKFARGRL